MEDSLTLDMCTPSNSATFGRDETLEFDRGDTEPSACDPTALPRNQGHVRATERHCLDYRYQTKVPPNLPHRFDMEGVDSVSRAVSTHHYTFLRKDTTSRSTDDQGSFLLFLGFPLGIVTMVSFVDVPKTSLNSTASLRS